MVVNAVKIAITMAMVKASQFSSDFHRRVVRSFLLDSCWVQTGKIKNEIENVDVNT